jgi:TolA-binding protein
MSLRIAAALALLAVAPLASADDLKKRDTLASLEDKEVEIRPGKEISSSSDLARESYRSFLELAATDPELQAEALRRLGDLELDASEAQQLAQNLDELDNSSFNNAVQLYQRLLSSYPDYRRNDTVLYQLARAYEVGGQTDEALETLDELVERFPDTPLIDEVQFRRGEMLFLRKRYNDAEMAYQEVVAYGDSSRFYEQSLYKLGWSQFKLSWFADSFGPFFALLDRKIGDIELGEGDDRLAVLSRAEQELVEDTFRVLSIGFSYLDGADSITEFFDANGQPDYGWVVYMNLGDLYLEQERYQDAALAYEAFVKKDPYHPRAPLLQVEVVEAYTQGGFPSLVLDGKKGFIDRYAMDGEYWARNTRAENAEVESLLKANLTDIAQYYHAEAQRGGRAEDYEEAAGYYRKYLAFFPGEADSAATNFLLAEILFDSGQLGEATVEYERTAYGYPAHEQASEAGYAALLGYREHEKALEGEARADWHQRYLDSGLRFADTFPEHPESGAVLTLVAEDLFAQNQFDLAIPVGQLVVTKAPPVKPELARTAWTVIAHSQFDLSDFAAAEQSYYQLRAFTPPDDPVAQKEVSDRIASSIYKQGEFARDMGDLEQAVGHFQRLGQVVPDSEFRMTAEYDAAAALITMGAFGRATGALEQFRRDYPDSEFADEVSANLAVTYLESGRGADAAQEFERIAAAPESTPEIRREALWKAADLYEKSNSLTSEQRVLENIVAQYPDPLSESIEARYRLLEIAREQGDQAVVNRRLQDLVQIDATAGTQRSDRTTYLAATASLELAEPALQRFEVVQLNQPLADSMKLKRSRMEEVIKAYTDAADYGVAEVTTAATYRLGEVYERFSTDLLESERPADLDAAALEQYELLLEEQIFPIEEKAIELYKANTDRAPDGVYDEWVEKSFNRLARLLPARYAKSERSEDVVTTLY